MLEKGSKQQREVSSMTRKLKRDLTQLIRAYERETGLEVVDLHYYTNDNFDTTTSQVLVQVRVAEFKDLED